MTPRQPAEEDPILAYLTRESDQLLARWTAEEEREREKEARERAEREPWRLPPRPTLRRSS